MDTPIFDLIKLAYARLLRPAFAEKIAQSPSKLDDFVLKMMDKIFDYDGTDK